MQVLSADVIFTGTEWLSGYDIIVDNGRIDQLVPSPAGSQERKMYEGCLIVPAFIDVQVYGAAGRLLAVYPDAETLQLMYDRFSEQGTALFLPTLATNTMEVFRKGIDAVRAYNTSGGKGVWGLHLEGPWLHPDKRGAHVGEWIHPPGMSEVRDLLDYGEGIIKMITIAPEVCSAEVVDYIRSRNIILSAGHSIAGFEEATSAFDSGVSAITHLFNAMSPLNHRQPGLVGAAFHHPFVRASIIPDGHHVDFACVSIAKKIMGKRLFAITDAVTETDNGPYRHQLAGSRYECNGVLSGSALSMQQACVNLVRFAGIEPDEALRMCSMYPAEVLGCDHLYGRIEPGAVAALLVLDKDLQVIELLT